MITFDRCLNYKGGKIVLLFDMAGDKIVIKTKKPYWVDFESLFLPVSPHENAPKVSDFAKILSDSLKFNQGIKHNGTEKELLSRLLHGSIDLLLEDNQNSQRLAGR